MAMHRWLFFVCALFSAGAFFPSSSAHAIETRVQYETIGQGYQILTVNGDVIKRHRLNQFLNLHAYDLTGDGSNRISFSSSLRFDSDFGIAQGDMDSMDQLRNHNLSLLFGYINVHRWLNMIDVRLGRQLLIDDMDFTMMEGLRTVIHTPWHFGVEIYAGTESKNAGYIGIITSTQLENDGDNGGHGNADEATSLVLGGSILLEELTNHHGKIGYRRVQTVDGGIDAEKVFANYHVRVLPKLHITAAASWDFLIMDVSDIQASVRTNKLMNFLDIELSYWRLIPTFEGSSIFNVFSIEPMNDLDGRFRFHLSKDVHAYVGGYLRLFRNAPDDNDVNVTDWIKDIGARAGGRVQFGHRGHIGLDITHQQGYGDLTIFDVGGAYRLLDNRLQLNGRLTTILFDDQLQENLNGTSFGVQFGAQYSPVESTRLHWINELNTNRFEELQFRVFAMIELDFWM